ncbi:hypothetical protein GCM10023196_071650 [Actinoallomurus vinaceus]|uniref:Hemerythrin-like domain-containing protein n=1 Tax=Actinoallomurus vinaceus TaxID=1080074 RepID=A0ABP8UKG1_9ACTN
MGGAVARPGSADKEDIVPTHRGSRDVIDVLTRDHRRVEDMFVRVITLSRDDRRRRYVVAKVITELMRHAAAEEEYLYPAVRAHVPDGERLAAERIAAHARTRQTIKELDGLDPSEARFDEVFRRLAGTTHEHLEDEEANIFPRLAGACDPDALRELGRKVERAERATPAWPSAGTAAVPPIEGWDGWFQHGPARGLNGHSARGLNGRPARLTR